MDNEFRKALTQCVANFRDFRDRLGYTGDDFILIVPPSFAAVFGERIELEDAILKVRTSVYLPVHGDVFDVYVYRDKGQSQEEIDQTVRRHVSYDFADTVFGTMGIEEAAN